MSKVHYLKLLSYVEDYIDVEKLLYLLGAKKVRVCGNNIRSECPLHNGDNPTAFSYDIVKKVWSCFSNRCGEGYRRNVYDLVYLYLLNKTGLPPTERDVFSILLQACNVEIDLDDIDFKFDKALQDRFDNIMFARQVKKRYNDMTTISTSLTLDDSLINRYNIVVHPYLLSRGLTEEAIETFEIRFAPKGISEKVSEDFPGRIVFPIRGIDNRLVGISGRLASDDIALISRYGKYRHLHSFKRNNVLYNINRAYPYVEKSKAAVLVEGFLDVISLWQKGIKNVMAVMGNNLSLSQMRDLLPFLNKVYICFDADKGGREGVRKAIKTLRNVCSLYYVSLSEGKDPDEVSKRELLEAFFRAKRIA